MSNHGSHDEFYVGYLPTPKGVLRWLRIAVPVMLWLAVPGAALVAVTMRSPGDAVWSYYQGEEPGTFTGTLTATPYPMLHWRDADGRDVSALLVEEGKLGAERAGAFDGRTVTVRANTLRRDGRLMLELLPDQIITVDDGTRAEPEPTHEHLGEATLSGEIMDAKCFLGAMKPGDGVAHRACARLCVSGGIPPVLVTTDSAGNHSYFLLTNGGGPANELALQCMGRPITVRGTLGRAGTWHTIDIEEISGL